MTIDSFRRGCGGVNFVPAAPARCSVDHGARRCGGAGDRTQHRIASTGLISMPSRSASCRDVGIAAHRHEGGLERRGAIRRNAGRGRERQRQIELQFGEIDQRIGGRIAGQFVSGRHLGEFRKPRFSSDLQQRAERLVAPQIVLAGTHRGKADDLAVDLAALHGEKHRRRARIAAHDFDVEAEIPWRWWRR